MNRIVFDCERMKYANTGLFSFCLQLGQRLKDLSDPYQEEISFYTPPTAAGIFGNDAHYINQSSLQKFWLPSLKGYDVWHATYQSTHYLPVLNRRIKVVLSIHDLNFLHEPDMPEAKKIKNLRHLQNNIDRADAIICISEFCKNDVLAHCEVGNKPIHIIHNGRNDLELPSLRRNSYRPRTRFLFSIGAVNRKKNFHVLLPLLQYNDDMELLIAGQPDDADYMHYMNMAARDMGVEGKFRVLGAISEQEKSWYYQNCYAFTFPSLAEGFGLPVTEAMSVGKPLFLSHKTALPEIGKDVAFYFRDFDADQMQEVFVDGMKKYKKLDMEGAIRKRGNDFCWKKAARQYLDVYRSL